MQRHVVPFGESLSMLQIPSYMDPCLRVDGSSQFIFFLRSAFVLLPTSSLQGSTQSASESDHPEFQKYQNMLLNARKTPE